MTLASALLLSGSALAASGGGSAVYGYDAGFPQCGATLPTGQQFGIAGLNDGLANNQNGCFTSELAWAEHSRGGTRQPLAAVYVNTGNPGDIMPAVADWPTSGTNIYGVCTGGDTSACAYQYGQVRAAQDVTWAMAAGLNRRGSQWWLDVENSNTWSTTTAENAADLEGMADYLRSEGAYVGVYSTNTQWSQIAGTYGRTLDADRNSLNGLADWYAGATTLTGAQAKCSTYTAFTPGGYPSLSQYVPTGSTLDSDWSCR